MTDASTTRQRFSRVCREFETSRLENALLAAAYECAVPTRSRRTRRMGDAQAAALTTAGQAEMDFSTTTLAKERQAG